MDFIHPKDYREEDVLVNIESGRNTVVIEGGEHINSGYSSSSSLECSSTSTDASVENIFGDKEENNELLEKVHSKRSRRKYKPPKPPRHPQALFLDAAEEKFAKEMSELAKLNRERIERMKALRDMKNAMQASSRNMKNEKEQFSDCDCIVLVVGIFVLLAIICRALFVLHMAGSFEGSPESLVEGTSSIISVQFNQNFSSNVLHDTRALGPKIAKHAPSTNGPGGTVGGTG